MGDAQTKVCADDVALPGWLVNSRAFGVLVVDQATDIVFANAAIADALGYDSADELTGRNLRASFLVDDSDWNAWERDGEHQFRLRDISGAPVSFHGEAGRSSDNPENALRYGVLSLQGGSNETGRLLEHAARMEAVAGLSSGIAHDFNNLLTVLVGNLYLLGEDLRGNESAFARIKAARDTALRGAELPLWCLSREPQGAGVVPRSLVHLLSPVARAYAGWGDDPV